MPHNVLTIWTPPERWITEITPGGIIRCTHKLQSDQLIIRLSDIPSLLSDQVLVPDALADRALDELVRRVG